jgi:hypothetical protein
MSKRNYTITMDVDLLNLVHRIAELDRRSGSNVIEVAVAHYAKKPEVRELLETA